MSYPSDIKSKEPIKLLATYFAVITSRGTLITLEARSPITADSAVAGMTPRLPTEGFSPFFDGSK
jgi:hypothetical protein